MRSCEWPVAKAKAIAQADATRQARHTMGKKQKAAIKGTVAPPAAAPAPAAPAASPAATPATPPATTTTK